MFSGLFMFEWAALPDGSHSASFVPFHHTVHLWDPIPQVCAVLESLSWCPAVLPPHLPHISLLKNTACYSFALLGTVNIFVHRCMTIWCEFLEVESVGQVYYDLTGLFSWEHHSSVHSIASCGNTHPSLASPASWDWNFFFFFFVFFLFFGPLPRHIEVPRLGVQSEL